MSTYPTTVDNATSLPYPTATSPRNNPSLAALNGSQNDALIALENKVGTGASTPTGTNLLVSTGTGTSAWTKAAPVGNIVGDTDTQTLTNKTLTSPTISSPSITNTGTITLPTATDTLVGRQTTDILTNKTISGANNTLSNIPYSGLLSTIFGGQVSTFTNTGTAGGTFYYINLGGIKLFWGQSAAVASGTTAYAVNFPASFFNSIQSVSVTPGPDVGTSQVAGSISAASTTSMGFFISAITGSGSMPAYVFVVGT